MSKKAKVLLYVERPLGQAEFMKRLAIALAKALPHLSSFFKMLKKEPWVDSAVVSAPGRRVET
ncbi:10378_t:CDS:2 [Gigaspora rosea]|nr:10378_t:CDS:2 [Gigaspora rosea]